MTKRGLDSEDEPATKSQRCNESSDPSAHSLAIGTRIQVLWEISDDKTASDEDELSYFSATVSKVEPNQLTITYDEVQDFSPASDCIVSLFNQNTLYCPSLAVEQKYRLEEPPVPEVSSGEASELLCPNGHQMTRDFSDVNVRTCECCLSIFHSQTGEWECKECEDWGACDRCVRLRLIVGHWVLCEELEEEEEVVRVTDVVEGFEAVTAEAAESLSKMPFEQQSNYARGYKTFVETVSKGLSDLLREKGADYVVTKSDVDAIVEGLGVKQHEEYNSTP